MNKPVVFSSALSGVFIVLVSFFQPGNLAESIERGKDLYGAYCMSCHMEDGNGTTGVCPPLANADFIKKPGSVLINNILLGQKGAVTVNKTKYDLEMPAQPYLTDPQIADIINYVRNSWGNKNKTAITPDQVKLLRK